MQARVGRLTRNTFKTTWVNLLFFCDIIQFPVTEHLRTVAEKSGSKYIYNTGLFISPSGTSELDCAKTKKDTAERNISISRESPKVFFCTRGLGVLADSTARG